MDVHKTTTNQFKSVHKKDVEEFIKARMRIDRISNHTITNDLQAILLFSKYTDKPFKKVTAEDIQDWEEFILKQHQSNNSKPYFPSTINLYLLKLKLFFKFIHNKEQYKRGRKFRRKIKDPKCTEWISIKFKSRDIPADYILKDNDIHQMIKVCDDIRDAAMVALLYDSGLRNSELRNLQIKSVTIGKQGGEVILPVKADENKTGTRKVFIITSVPYLKQFLNYHPYKDYPDAPLFYSRDRVNSYIIKKMSKGELEKEDLETLKLNRTSVIDIVKNVGKKACMKVPVYPHLLRHSSATNYARLGLTDAEMRIRYGWSKTSNMPSRYIHIASADMNHKILRLNGLIPEDEIKKEEILKPIVCPDCGLENPATFSYCGSCRMPLKIKLIKNQKTEDVVEDSDKAKEMIKELVSMIDKPISKEYQKKIDNWIK